MDNNTPNLWQKVEQDQKKYKWLTLVGVTMWLIALGALAYIGYLFYLELQILTQRYETGLVKMVDIYNAKKNIYVVVLAISIIIACLTSIVLLMRQRSNALHDIQIRLALLEQHISGTSKEKL